MDCLWAVGSAGGESVRRKGNLRRNASDSAGGAPRPRRGESLSKMPCWGGEVPEWVLGAPGAPDTLGVTLGGA